MKIRQIIILLGILILPSVAFSDDNALEFRVKLDVKGDGSLESRIVSYLSRELRALGDVIQSKDNYKYDITVLGVKLDNKGGDEFGVVLTVNIYTKFDNQPFSFMFKEEFVKAGIKLTNGLYYYPKYWVRIGSEHDLRSICRGIIADFDSQILQKQRYEFQEHIDFLNEEDKDSANK